MSVDKDTTVLSVNFQRDISADTLGRHLGGLTSDQQAAVILSTVEDIERWKNWPMQCRYIAECFSAEQKSRVASCLRILLDHLEETP